MADPIPKTATPPTLPPATDQFSRVHDAYGPGPFLAWLLAAYILAFQLSSTLKQRPQRQLWTVNKDLAMVLLYPAFAAAHLLYQVAHYPGARDKIWGTDFYQEEYRTPAADLEYAHAVRAAARVCTAGLAFNIGLMAVPERRKWRRYIVSVVSIWLIFALEFASWDSSSGLWMLGDVFSVLWTGLLLISLPCCLAIPLVILYQGTRSLVQMIPSFRRDLQQRGLKFIGIMLFMALFYTPFLLLVIVVLWGMVWLGLTMCVMPVTKHPVTEIFQAMTLVLGVLNVLFTWKEVSGGEELEEEVDLARGLEKEERRIGPVLALGVANMVAPVRYLWRREEMVHGSERRGGTESGVRIQITREDGKEVKWEE